MPPLFTSDLMLNNLRSQIPTDEETTVADASTPEQVNAPSTPATSTFEVPVEQDITSDTLQGNTTFDDVRNMRDQMEAQQSTQRDISEFEPTAIATPFNDPEQFILSTLYGDNEPTAAEQGLQETRQEISQTTGRIEERLSGAEERAERTTQLSERERALAETNNKIAQRQARFRREMRAFEETSERRGADRQFVQSERQKLEADATAELADLYIIQNAQQGNVTAARDYIDTAVNNRYRSIQIELQQKQAELADYEATVEGEEKERAQQLQIALAERERNLGIEMNEEKNKRSLMLEVAGLGGSSSLQERILKAPTEDQATLLASDFIGKTVRSQAAASATGGGGLKPPTIKEINGVDYQWNEQLGIWEEVSIAGGRVDADKTADTVSNLNFLLDTTDRILGSETSSVDGSEKDYDALYEGSAQSVVTRGIGNLFTGTNKQKRLEAQVDTLRSNMLTLATDPAIKEFFGPQMSDADVKLMTAAGTSLRPGSQSDDELKAETERIQDWINRARTSVIDSTSTRGQNIITAPDGTRVEIID